MYQKAIQVVRHSIFPIFLTKTENGKHILTAAGSGFFINDKGYFLSAHHVFHSNPDRTFMPVFLGNLPFQTTNKMVEIEEIYSDPSRDVFLGRVSSEFLTPVKMNFEPQNEGKSVVLSGYPMPIITVNPQHGGFELGNVRQYWQPTIIIDQFEKFAMNKAVPNVFMTQHAALNGMSGAPTFDLDGTVIGMSIATSNRKLPQSDGEMRVDNGIVVKLSSLRDVIDLAG